LQKIAKFLPKKISPVTCKLGFEGKKPDFKPESDHGKLCHQQIWYFSSRSIAFIEMLLSSSILQIVLKWQTIFFLYTCGFLPLSTFQSKPFILLI
jgi:hypothetical protein